MGTPQERGPDSPPSPSASFYAMSDDDEGEYNTIRHTKTGKGVKLLYTKSKACARTAHWPIWPLPVEARLMYLIGLRASFTLLKRQYRRLRGLDPTEAAGRRSFRQ